jgi:tetratricopeptide (TPR) repeat protein
LLTVPAAEDDLLMGRGTSRPPPVHRAALPAAGFMRVLPDMLRPACTRQGRRVSGRRAFGIGAVVLWVAMTMLSAEAARLQDEDPFADELNPFGTGRRPAPSAPAEEPAPDRLPRREDDRPLDEPAVPPAQPPADRPLPPRDQPRQRPRLPVPFPDSDLPADRFDRRGGALRRDDRQSSPDADWRRRRDGDDAFEAPVPRPPSVAEQKLLEADRLEKSGDLAGARDRLEEVVKLAPTLPLGHLALGVVLRRMGDFRGSVAACSKGIAVDPQEPELYLRRGIAWFHLGMHGIALEDFEEAAGLAYDDPRPEMWRGLTLMELERPLEAINAYAAAIRRDRTSMLAYLNRGLAYLATNEPRKAEFDFNQAIRQAPSDPRAWANRGVAQARQARYREAIESYETALKIAPGDAATRRNLEAARRLLPR